MRAGATLMELLIVLVLLGTILALVAPSARPIRTTAGPGDSVAALRHLAIASGRPQLATLLVDGERTAVTALPDGRVIVGTGATRRLRLTATSYDRP